MAYPFIGEIRLFGGNFAPGGWALCDGRLLSIPENQSLFDLIGTTYGGDGRATFAVPDLRGRAPVHRGEGYAVGRQGGEESVTLSVAELPTHNHPAVFSTAPATQPSPAGNLPAAGTAVYADAPATEPMANGSIAPAGGGQPHENRQRYLCVSFIIATDGFPPPR